MHNPTGRGGEVVQDIISCRRNKLGRNYEESSTWGETELSVCGKWRSDAQVEWGWWVSLGCWQGTDSMCQYQACTCSAASVT